MNDKIKQVENLETIDPIGEVFDAAEKVVKKVTNDPSVQKIHHEFIERLWTIAVAAVGLIAAFAWDRFLRELIDVIFTKNESLWVLFGYAVVMTAIAAIVATQIPRIERWYEKYLCKHHTRQKTSAPHIPVGKHLKD